MSILYVTEPGLQVHQEGQRLIVKKGTEILQDIPMIKVERVVLMGKGVSITTPTLYALSQRKIGVFYLNSQGRYILRTVGEEHGHSRLRQAQAIATTDAGRGLAAARAIVLGKISNQRVLVQRHAEGADWAAQALAQMNAMRLRLEGATTPDELRGFEGLAAKEYFSIYRRLLRPPQDGRAWGFDRRVYYPPTDPVNALLSFGYTLLLNDLVAACQMTGLDPALGFFHTIDYNKPSMALDLEEEFRPVVVDSIVLTVINRPYFGLRDFEVGQPLPAKGAEEDAAPAAPPAAAPRPIYLKDAARRRFLELYEARVNEQVLYPPAAEQTSYRRIFELQAYQMAHLILGEADRYLPMLIR